MRFENGVGRYLLLLALVAERISSAPGIAAVAQGGSEVALVLGEEVKVGHVGNAANGVTRDVLGNAHARRVAAGEEAGPQVGEQTGSGT